MTERLCRWLIGNGWGRPASPPLAEEHYWMREGEGWASLCHTFLLPPLSWFEGTPSIDLYFDDGPDAHRCETCVAIFSKTEWSKLIGGIVAPSTV